MKPWMDGEAGRGSVAEATLNQAGSRWAGSERAEDREVLRTAGREAGATRRRGVRGIPPIHDEAVGLSHE
jgi:hypothetical protein